MSIDLDAMTIKELQELISEANSTIERKQEDEKKKLLSEMRQMAEDRGFDYDELTGAKKKERKRAAPKYQNPDNLKQTWSGMGRQPKWIEEQLASGKSLQDLEIK